MQVARPVRHVVTEDGRLTIQPRHAESQATANVVSVDVSAKSNRGHSDRRMTKKSHFFVEILKKGKNKVFC